MLKQTLAASALCGRPRLREIRWHRSIVNLSSPLKWRIENETGSRRFGTSDRHHHSRCSRPLVQRADPELDRDAFACFLRQCGDRGFEGDLSKFRIIVVDTAKLVDSNDLTGAKKRIKDLETSWDEAESALKPRAAADWHKLDKSIDDALEAIRESSPSQAKCKKTLADLLALMDRMNGKA